MVKIVGGEVVPDSDPRVVAALQQLQWQHHLATTQTADSSSVPSSSSATLPSPTTHSRTSSPFHSAASTPISNNNIRTLHSSTLPPPLSLSQSPQPPNLPLNRQKIRTATVTAAPHHNAQLPKIDEAQHHHHQTSPEEYGILGLPSIQVERLTIPPHVYLPIGLCIYFIGTTAFIAALAACFFYRWHLKQQQKHDEFLSKKQMYQAPLQPASQMPMHHSPHPYTPSSHATVTTNSPFLTAQSPGARNRRRIHSIHDLPS